MRVFVCACLFIRVCMFVYLGVYLCVFVYVDIYHAGRGKEGIDVRFKVRLHFGVVALIVHVPPSHCKFTSWYLEGSNSRLGHNSKLNTISLMCSSSLQRIQTTYSNRQRLREDQGRFPISGSLQMVTVFGRNI